MAIDKKLIHFKTWNKFIEQIGGEANITTPTSGKEEDGTALYGQIKGTSIVFIKDVGKIWTHGRVYDTKIDDVLDDTSTNPVQNKVIAEEFEAIAEKFDKQQCVFVVSSNGTAPENYKQQNKESYNKVYESIDADRWMNVFVWYSGYFRIQVDSITISGSNELVLYATFDDSFIEFRVSSDGSVVTQNSGSLKIDSSISTTSTNAVQNKVVTAYVNTEVAKKQNTLISGTNIKTINGNNILGEGNIDISGYDDTEIKTNLETIGKMAYAASMQSSNHENAVIPELREEIAAVQPMISVTWSELKEMRDNATLKPGQQYRITDYVTTTSQANTRSVEHPFDVIVTADSENTLNEEARACIHEGDTYFSDAGAKLEAWKIWYCLDNDKARFPWSVTKTKESISVDLDGMSITAEYVGTYEYDGTMFHRWDFFMSGENGSFLTVSENPQVGDTTSFFGIIEQDMFFPYSLPIVSVNEPSENEGFGVIYRMIDEQNNDVPYDFKNIRFVRKVTLGKLDLENGTDEFVFTFNSFDESVGRSSDLSLNRLLCGHNTIKKIAVGLNNIVFLNKSTSSFGCYYNTFEIGCFNNTFGDDCYSNTFGENCSDNIFGDDCYSNTFGDDCYYNTFGNNCNSNTFGNNCNYNTFGDGCYSNTFGWCYSNTFGDHCKYNTFGDDCRDNTFGDECYSNTFGYNFSNNTFESGNYNIFGNYCMDNTFNNVNTCTFGNQFSHNIFEGYCRSNSFGNDCHNNSFGGNFTYNSFGNNCYDNSFRSSASSTASLKSYCSHNHFDDGCSYNVIWNSDTTGAANALQNINVNRGVSGTSSNYNFINVTTLNADYEIQVAKNSKGEIKIYCEADLIA